MQFLPTEIRGWINSGGLNLDNCSNDSLLGCFLEVYLDYYYQLHDLHCDYAFVGEKIKVTEKMLLEY